MTMQLIQIGDVLIAPDKITAVSWMSSQIGTRALHVAFVGGGYILLEEEDPSRANRVGPAQPFLATLKRLCEVHEAPWIANVN